jgi:hypothetical protein
MTLELNSGAVLCETNFNQHSETNVTHFLFSLLRIKGLYMFRALLAHPQEALHNRRLVYCVRVMSVGFTMIEVKLRSTSILLQHVCVCVCVLTTHPI